MLVQKAWCNRCSYFCGLLLKNISRSLQTIVNMMHVITPTPNVIPIPLEDMRSSLLDVFFLIEADSLDRLTTSIFFSSSILFLRTIGSLIKFCDASL